MVFALVVLLGIGGAAYFATGRGAGPETTGLGEVKLPGAEVKARLDRFNNDPTSFIILHDRIGQYAMPCGAALQGAPCDILEVQTNNLTGARFYRVRVRQPDGSTVEGWTPLVVR